MELKLTIRTGNDAMQSGEDLAQALERAAKHVRYLGAEPLTEGISSQRVLDGNGQSVGSWWIEEDEPADAGLEDDLRLIRKYDGE
jgi:hypothetical protein